MPEPSSAAAPPIRPAGNPAAFLDRDGTIIVEREYLADPGGVELIPGALDGLKALSKAGYELVLVTNQSGIARGYYGVDDYLAVQRRLYALLEGAGIRLDPAYFCPHHPDVGGPCACRKPATGLYLQATRERRLDPAASLFIGDKLSDVQPAAAFGGTGILLRTGYGRASEAELARRRAAAPGSPWDDVVVLPDLGALSGWLASTRSRACGPETFRPD